MAVLGFFLKVIFQSYFLAVREAFSLGYIALTNATVLGAVLYMTRAVIRTSLWITNRLIEKTTTGKTNPIVNVVKKDLGKVPKSKVMVSDKHESAKGVIGESVEEIKVVSTADYADHILIK